MDLSYQNIQRSQGGDAGSPACVEPFESAEEAWFWFMAAQQALNDGARITSGNSLYPRPCEPVDILNILDRLYRHRRLLREHLLVLRHYGLRRMPPDPTRRREVRAYGLWCDALERLEEVFERKGIVVSAQHFMPPQSPDSCLSVSPARGVS